jgi:hypothetical protein
MFERYTENARRTIFFARHEASNFASPYIETEHLLLGLLNDGFLASFVLQGISAQGIREDILATLPRQKEIPTSVDLPLSSNAKQALSYGAEEAERLADRQIRNQHLLLGLMRVEDSYAAQMLRQKGFDPANLRLRIAELQPKEGKTIRGASGGGTRWTPKSPSIPAGYAWPRLLYNPASKILILELHGAGEERPTRPPLSVTVRPLPGSLTILEYYVARFSGVVNKLETKPQILAGELGWQRRKSRIGDAKPCGMVQWDISGASHQLHARNLASLEDGKLNGNHTAHHSRSTC